MLYRIYCIAVFTFKSWTLNLNEGVGSYLARSAFFGIINPKIFPSSNSLLIEAYISLKCYFLPNKWQANWATATWVILLALFEC